MLEVLRSVIQEVNRARDLGAVLDIIVERVKDAMNTEVCSVYLHDEHDERFVFMATRGLNTCLLYTSPSPRRDQRGSRMPSSA